MITLHESNITTFPMDNGIGVLRDAIQAYAEEELNGMFEFYMEYDSEGHLVDELKEERIIKAKAQDKLGYQLFRIYSITKNHDNDNLIIRAQHITYDLADNFVEKLEANNLTKKQVMELIGSSTVLPHPFNITSPNTTTRSSTKLYRTNPLQMIGGIEGSVLQIWGGQIERDNFNLILHDRRGSDDGVKVTYEKNITGLTAEFDIGNLVTRIFPFVYIEATDNEPARLITVSGKYIDSPLINNYEKIYIEPIDYSNDERIDTQDKTDAQIRQQLTNIASQYFNETGNDKIKVDMEVQFEHLWETEEYKDLAVLELVGLGDTVTINHSKLKVDATAIVNYIRYDCIAEKNEEVRLGSVKARLTDNVNRVVDVAEKVEQAQQTANQAIRAANGKNTIYYGPDEPEGGIEGDLWFRVVDGEYTRTYRHDGIQWQLVLSVDVRDAIDEAQQAKDDAQSAVDRANQATQQATDAINQAQTAFDEAQQALGTANNAMTQATSAFTTANEAFNEVESLSEKVDENTGEISTIKQSVIGLQTQVNDNAGNISSLTQIAQGLQTQVTDIEGNVSTLQQTASSLASRITNTEGNISTLTQTANGLQTKVSNNEKNISTVTQTANALQTRMTNAEGNISTLTQTASSLQSTISSVRADLDGLEIGGRNLIINSTTRRVIPFGTGTIINHEDDVVVEEWNTSSAKRAYGVGGSSTSFAVFSANRKDTNTTKSGQKYVHSIYIKNNNNNILNVSNNIGNFEQVPPGVAKRVIIHGVGNGIQYLQFVFRTTKAGESFDFIYWQPQIENGNRATDWTPAPEDMATQSQITQLSDAINLRVQKGDVINQINISDESILIDGKRIHITGQTTIDNGVIKSAHIQSLDAGKITTGTLDAGRISVINLSANSISGGMLTSLNSITRFNLNTGVLNIGSQLELSSRGLETYSGGYRVSLLDGVGHHFYRQDTYIGKIGTNNWAGDTSYRGLVFSLENNTDYMAWEFRKTSSAPNYTTMLAWHKTSAKTTNKGFTFYDNVKFSSRFDMLGRGYVSSYTRAVEWGVRDGNYHIIQYDDGQVQFHMGSITATHTFFPNGTKAGGSIEIDGTTYGMSPIDSPQVLIEYIEFDVELSEIGTKVYVDKTFLKATENFAVFPNNGNVVEKGSDYFIVAGSGVADVRIVGKRVEYNHAFWADMESLPSPEEKPQENNMIQMTTSQSHKERVKENWFAEQIKTRTEKVDGVDRKVIERLDVN